MPIPALIGAGATLLGGFMLGRSQSSSNKAYLQGVQDTNATNLQIQRETNQQNLDMFNAANAFSEKMWNKENQYNTPAAVRARLIAAGISPSAMADASTASSVQSVGGSPAQAARMQAPEQMPVPMEALSKSIGGSVREFLDVAMMKEQLKQSRYATEMKLIDKDYYLQQKSNEIVRQMRDLDTLHLSNKEKMLRLDYLRQELEDNAQLRRRMMRAADDEHDNAIRTGREIDSRVNLNESTIARNLAEINNMSVQQQIAWFNARTDRAIGSAQVSHLNQTVSNLREALRQSKENFSAGAWLRMNQGRLDDLTLQSKEILVSQMQQELSGLVLRNQLDRDKASGLLNDFSRQVLGVDLEHVFSGAFVTSVRPGAR